MPFRFDRLSFASLFFSLLTALHGQPIQLHPLNPHYFLFRGKATALIASGEHYGAVLNTAFDFRRYLAAIEADGLNYTRLFGGSYVEVPGKSFEILRNDLAPEPGRYLAPWARSTSGGYAGGGNKFDLQKWNPDYFDRYRAFLTEAGKRGIVVEISLFSSQYGEAQWAISPFNSANNVNHTDAINWKELETRQNGNILPFQEAYVRKLVREAGAFDNVIFEIQNEPWSDRGELAGVINPYLPLPGRNMYPNSIDLADALSADWQASVAEWISSGEAALTSKHLIAQNYCNFRFPVRSLIPGVSVVNFHYAYPEAASWNYGLNKAIGYDETGFLGREDDAYRRQAWNFMLAGGSAYDALDYSFSPGHEDGLDTAPNGPGGGSHKLRQQLRVLREFLESFSLVNLRPDTRLVKFVTGAEAHALSDAGREYAVYFDGDGPLDATLSLPAGQFAASWIDLRDGRVQKTVSVRDGNRLTSPAFKNGIALKLKLIGAP